MPISSIKALKNAPNIISFGLLYLQNIINDSMQYAYTDDNHINIEWSTD